MSPELCDVFGCDAYAVASMYIRWTEAHQHFNVWRACTRHRAGLFAALLAGELSGGVRPVEYRFWPAAAR